MKQLVKSTAITAILFSTAFSAYAEQYQWTISSLKFDDDGQASGTFVYDTNTNAYSNIDIDTTQGDTFDQPASYQYSCVTPCTMTVSANSVVFLNRNSTQDLQGARALTLTFDKPLSNDLAKLTQANEATCKNSVCSAMNSRDTRQMFDQADVSAKPFDPTTPTPTPVPVPALSQWGLMLLTVLLGGLAFWRQRRS